MFHGSRFLFFKRIYTQVLLPCKAAKTTHWQITYV